MLILKGKYLRKITLKNIAQYDTRYITKNKRKILLVLLEKRQKEVKSDNEIITNEGKSCSIMNQYTNFISDIEGCNAKTEQ